ncbi:MAG: cysteine peptidase family C39 domain-containing protein [Gammaproteobacteria bacterium]
MDPHISFVATTSVAVVAAVAAYGACRQRPARLGPFAAAGFLLLMLSVLPRLLPEWLYWLFPPHPVAEVLLANAFLLSGSLAAAYRDSGFRVVLQVLLMPLMVYYVLFPAGWLAVHGDEIRRLHRRVVDGVTIQSFHAGCVPASLATVLRSYGLEYHEGELALALRTTPLGTDFSRIPRVVREFGVARGLTASFVRTDVAGLAELEHPALLFVYAGRIKHATAFLGMAGDDVVLGEPLRGRERIPRGEFVERTRWRGLAAVIHPAATAAD